MGNRITLALIIFFCSCFSFSAFSAGTKAASTGKCESVKGDIGNIVDKLDYVGLKFPDKAATCVEAFNDNEAAAACSKAGGVRYINPGNPQYIDVGQDSRASRSTNGLGYYLCFKTNQNDKQRICNELMSSPQNSTYNNGLNSGDENYVHFQWKSIGLRDGDCNCNHPNATNKLGKALRECSQKTIAKEEKKVEEEKPAAAEPAAEVSSEPSDDLKKCVAGHEELIKKCEVESTAAKKQCTKDKTQEDKDYNDKMKYVTSISNAMIQGHAGQGAQAQCAGASLLSSGAAALMKALQTGCEADLTACFDSCRGAEKTFKEVCVQYVKSSDDAIPSADDKYVSDYWIKYQNTIDKSVKLCTVEAKNDNDNLKTALNAFSDSQTSAAKCACQLSSSGLPPGIGNCDSLPTALNCLQTPGIPGCATPITLSCALGSADYATPKCQCMHDPSLTICKAEPGKVPFAFASDLKAINAGNTGGVGGGSGGTGSNMDLGPFNQASDAQADDKNPQGSAPGFNTAAGSPGGGGGGGGGSGGGDGPGSAAEGAGEPAEKNLGLFGMAKSAMSSFFGKGSSAAGKDARNKNANSTPDAEKWRPRGLASTGCKSSQIRCKNETIWEIMNNRYGSNENSFILKP